MCWIIIFFRGGLKLCAELLSNQSTGHFIKYWGMLCELKWVYKARKLQNSDKIFLPLEWSLSVRNFLTMEQYWLPGYYALL